VENELRTRVTRRNGKCVILGNCLGRGVRLSSETGKTDCLVIDLVDNAPRHTHSLVTLPTLFGLPPQFRLTGEHVDEAAGRLDLAAQALESGLDDQVLERIRSVADIPRMFREFDFWRITGIPTTEAALTPFLWQRLPGGTLILSVPKPKPDINPTHFTLRAPAVSGPARIVIQPNAIDHYELREFRSPKEITKLAEVASLHEAFAIAHDHVTRTYPDRLALLRRDQVWRNDPISPKQIEILRRFRIPMWKR